MGLAPFTFHTDAAVPTNKKAEFKFSLPWFGYTLIICLGYFFAFSVAVETSWKVPLSRNYPLISVVGRRA